MERYDYYEAVKNDVMNYIRENVELSEVEDWDALDEQLNEDLWTCDCVTGNGSGSYTFNAWEAEENLCHNMDLLQEALSEFGCGIDYLEKGAESCDVTIRCYLLHQAITECLEELRDESEED